MISPSSSKIILVADDEVHLNDSLRYNLESEGYRVITAYDGQEAVKKTRKYLPDLVILDVMMPIMDGWQVCTTIRADDRTRSIPIIFLSARGRPEDMLRGFALGANDYVVKPFVPELLFARIEAVLRTIQSEKPADRKERRTVKTRIKTVFDPYHLAGNLFSERYKLTEYAGGGGMGAVYRALDITNQNRVAVKILKPDVVARNPEYIELFDKEVKAAQRLNHVHIVRVLDRGTHNNVAFMVMEWLEGWSLDDVLLREQLPLNRVVGIFEQICEAISFAHKNKIIHLDIKPANILLLTDHPTTMMTGAQFNELSNRRKDFLKVIDFGLARVISRESGTTVTRFRGTFQYCAPEQFGGKVSSKSDIYSLGATLYFLLAGVIPFSGSYINAKINPNLGDNIVD